MAKKIKGIFNLVIGLTILISLVLVFIKFIVPFLLRILNMVLMLVELYKLLEMPYLFFGSAIFIFMLWYIFVSFISVGSTLLNYSVKKINKFIEQNKKNEKTTKNN